MTRKRVSNNLFLIVIILVIILGFAAPVTGAQIHVDLGKQFVFKNATVRYIDAIDVVNLSESRIEMFNTLPDSSDIRTIHTPVFNIVTRRFINTTGHFNNVTLTVNGPTVTSVDWTTKPDFKIYNQSLIPTFSIAAPGLVGNPVVIKYNESWSKGDMTTMSAFLRTSDFAYLHKTTGLAHINSHTNTYTSYPAGVFDNSNTNMNDITFTLSKNKVALDAFSSSRSSAEDMGSFYPETLPTRGKYFASAIDFNPNTFTITVNAMAPVVILENNTVMDWEVGGVRYIRPPAYNSADGDVQLRFNSTGSDTATIRNITYLILNRTATYDMVIQIDPDILAQNAENRWNGYSSDIHIINLLYQMIAHDFGDPFTYNLSAHGCSTFVGSASQWSRIAVSPGHGISGNFTSNQVQVPAANMSTLAPGNYDVYLMGTDQNNTVIAFDQKVVVVTGGITVPAANFTTDVNQSGHNLRVQFYDNSTNTPTTWNWTFGDGNTTGNTLQNPVHYYIQNDITPNQTYTVSLNATNAAGSNTVTKPNYILVKSFSQFYREASAPYTGMISTSEFTVAIEDWRLGRIPAGYTKTVPTPVFTVLIEDWRLGRPLA